MGTVVLSNLLANYPAETKNWLSGAVLLQTPINGLETIKSLEISCYRLYTRAFGNRLKEILLSHKEVMQKAVEQKCGISDMVAHLSTED